MTLPADVPPMAAPVAVDDSTRGTSDAVRQALAKLAGVARLHLHLAEGTGPADPRRSPRDTYPPKG